MNGLRVLHTAYLDATELARVRAMLDDAFAGRFDDQDWDHALGGLHVLLDVEGSVVAHAAVVARRLLHEGRSLRCGYVEAVAVDARWRGRGYGAAVMTEVEHIVTGGYDLGALSAGERASAFYAERGWRLWPGSTGVLAPTGVEPTPEDDDSTFVWLNPERPALPLTGALVCDWRAGDVW